jgi:hypothetical protein
MPTTIDEAVTRPDLEGRTMDAASPAELPAAEPLQRLGSYSIPEKGGANPLPLARVAPEALRHYWLQLLGALTAKWKQRDELAKRLSDPAKALDAIRYRYTGKIELKSAEAVAALLHGILAPDAPFLCNEGCPHVLAGAQPEMAKRYLDSLDAEILNCRTRWKGTPCTHITWEDLQDEFEVYERWRREFGKLLVSACPR